MTYTKNTIKFLTVPTHPNTKNLTGRVFTYLTVLGVIDFDAKHRPIWICRCKCGNLVRAITNALTSGNTKSCKCWQKEQASRTKTTHGHAKTPEYVAWKTMRARCNRQTVQSFSNYGGRGIQVCDRWNDFALFIEDMGWRPSPNHTVERRDNDGNYTPENCYWASRTVQSRNKRTTLRIAYQGKTQPLAQWCEELKYPYGLIYHRLHRGWSPERAFSTPKKV